MKIILSPQWRTERLVLERDGDTIITNGVATDFSGLAEGERLTSQEIASSWFTGAGVTRIDGELEMTIIVPHGDRAPEETLFPEPIIDAEDGAVALPPYNRPGVL
jgi:hypothetical protein